MLLPDGLVQGVIVQPEGMRTLESGIGSFLSRSCRTIKSGFCLFQAIMMWCSKGRLRHQPTGFNQIIKTDQTGVTGMYGQALVRGVVGMRGSQWQHLPNTDSRRLQEINKAPRILTNITLLTGTGQ